MGVRFFSDFEVFHSKRIGITNLLSNITTRDGSHKGGWARLLKCQLQNLGYKKGKILDNKDNLSDFDVIIFDLGAEYSGALNMFGGLDEKVFKRLNEIKNFKGDLFSWRNDVPNLSVLEGRRNNASSCEAFKATPETFLTDVDLVLQKTRTFDHAYPTNKLLIGDSHTPSVWTPDYMIERQDGRTLYGSLTNSTILSLVDKFEGRVMHLMVHMSNIDVRHHLCRQDKPEIATANLAQSLMCTLNDLRMMLGISTVTVCHTVGIEDESRELPKTGYYKGTPFYGSWEERNRVRNIYNAMVDELAVHFGYDVVKFPEVFFDEQGKFKFDVMEKPQSVHLSPEFYRWDLDENTNRWSTYDKPIAGYEHGSGILATQVKVTCDDQTTGTTTV
jgi:hypothetical protein